MKTADGRISDLQFFLVFSAVFGVGTFLRSGLGWAVVTVVLLGLVILAMRLWSNRSARK